MEGFANGNGPTGGNSGIGSTTPVIPVVADRPTDDPYHWWRLI